MFLEICFKLEKVFLWWEMMNETDGGVVGLFLILACLGACLAGVAKQAPLGQISHFARCAYLI